MTDKKKIKSFAEIVVLDEDMTTEGLQQIKTTTVEKGPLLVQFVGMKPVTQNRNRLGFHRKITWRDGQ